LKKEGAMQVAVWSGQKAVRGGPCSGPCRRIGLARPALNLDLPILNETLDQIQSMARGTRAAGKAPVQAIDPYSDVRLNLNIARARLQENLPNDEVYKTIDIAAAAARAANGVLAQTTTQTKLTSEQTTQLIRLRETARTAAESMQHANTQALIEEGRNVRKMLEGLGQLKPEPRRVWVPKKALHVDFDHPGKLSSARPKGHY
jgi:hypothetical protein